MDLSIRISFVVCLDDDNDGDVVKIVADAVDDDFDNTILKITQF